MSDQTQEIQNIIEKYLNANSYQSHNKLKKGVRKALIKAGYDNVGVEIDTETGELIVQYSPDEEDE